MKSHNIVLDTLKKELIKEKQDQIRSWVKNGLSLSVAIGIVKNETTLGKASWQEVIDGLYDDPICEKHLVIKTYCKSSIQDEKGYTCLDCLEEILNRGGF